MAPSLLSFISAKVASAPLSCGEVILKESPLLALPDSFDDVDVLVNQTSLSCLVGFLASLMVGC